MIKKEYIKPEVEEFAIKMQTAFLDLSKVDIDDKEPVEGEDDFENW